MMPCYSACFGADRNPASASSPTQIKPLLLRGRSAKTLMLLALLITAFGWQSCKQSFAAEQPEAPNPVLLAKSQLIAVENGLTFRDLNKNQKLDIY